MRSAATGRPVLLRDGSKIEEVVDLSLSSPGFTWTVSRNYRTQAYAPAGSTAFGTKWFGGDAEMRLDGSYGGQIRLIITSSAARIFEYDSANSVYVSPPDSNLTLERQQYQTSPDKYRYVVTDEETDNVYVFYDLDYLSTDYGRLWERTTRHRWAQKTLSPPQPTSGAVYKYDSLGRIASVTLPQGLDYFVEYKYDGSSKSVKEIHVWQDAAKQKEYAQVLYTYFVGGVGQSASLGCVGDLVQVIVRKRDSNETGWIERATQYRYYQGGTHPTLGYYAAFGYLKAVYEHDALQRIIALKGCTTTTLSTILASSDATTVAGSSTIKDYASLRVGYHAEDDGWGIDQNSSPIYVGYDTLRTADEDLETDLGAENVPETHEGGPVREEIIGGGCSSCGDSEQQLIRRYHYLWVNKGGNPHTYYVNGGDRADVNEVTWIVVEDTAKPNGANPPIHLYRKIYGMNDYFRKLREAFIEYPAGGGMRVWCQAWRFAPFSGSPGDPADRLQHRLAEYRGPACYNVTDPAGLRNFLHPYDDPSDSNNASGNWGNDEAAFSGNGEFFKYEYNADGYLTGTLVRNGWNSMAPAAYHYLSATDYGDGDGDGVGHDKDLESLPIASHVYPKAVTARNDPSRITTTYTYQFWDNPGDRQIKKTTTTLPKVDVSQNGAGLGAPYTTTEKYYDNRGRLRWSVDGEGYINYYSYHPASGELAYEVIDVDPASLPGSADANPLKWVASGDGDPGPTLNRPTRSFSSPASLALVTATEFDRLGRVRLTTELGGGKHYTAYQVAGSGCAKVERMIQYPYWTGSTSSGAPLLPIQVTELNNQGKVSKVYALPATASAINYHSDNVTGPVGVKETSGSLNYVSLSINAYDGASGQLKHTDRYHKIPAYNALPGALSTNFDRTCHIYAPEGRPAGGIKTVEGTETSAVVQAIFNDLDVLGRVIGTKRWRGTAFDVTPAQVNYDWVKSLADAKPPSTTTEYDADGVGANFVTKSRRYYGTGANDYLESNFTRTFRGHLRGVHRKNGTASVTPYNVMDVDWMGRQTATAQYATAPATWPTDYANYVYNGNPASPAPVTPSHFELSIIHYDPVGRVYRTERYPAVHANTRFQVNNYYDRNDRLVCTGDKYTAHAEYAYDGAGRQFQQRVVSIVPATPFTGAKFTYRLPHPDSEFDYDTAWNSTLAGSGNQGVIEIAHSRFDEDGNVVEEHQFELNHTDTNGIAIGVTGSYVRSSQYSWYDAADRLTTTGNYGAGGASTGPGTWTYNATMPTRGSAPTASADDVLVTKYGYDDIRSGRQNAVTDPNGVVAKTFFDDLGRRTHLVENWQTGFDPTGGAAGNAAADKDRITKWTYYGLGQVATLTARNDGAPDQVTKYFYMDNYDVSLVTNVIYPDSVETTPVLPFQPPGFDQVRRNYNLDGSASYFTDQRGVIHEYAYNNRRQLEVDKVINIPSTVYGGGGEADAVKTISRVYDDFGRLTHVTSHGNVTSDPLNVADVENQIQYVFGTHGKVASIHQAHGGVVSIGTSPSVSIGIDTTATSGILDSALRVSLIGYPDIGYSNPQYNGVGGTTTIDDRLHRPYFMGMAVGATFGGGYGGNSFDYRYNGVSRVARIGAKYSSTTVVDRSAASATGNYDSWDRFGRTLSHTWKNGSGVVLDQTNYRYDSAGNRLSRDVVAATNDNHDQLYAYDGLHRLKNYDQGTGSFPLPPTAPSITTSNKKRSWGLDALGNWDKTYSDLTQTTVEQDRTHNEANELTGFTAGGWATPALDAAGNMTTIPQPSTPASSYALKYDPWNRLVTVHAGPALVQRNEYDGRNQRIVRLDAAASETYDYYYNDQWQVLCEDKNGTRYAYYFWHPEYVDALAVRCRQSEAQIILQDANYNVTAAVDSHPSSGTNGQVIERYAYSPYGEATVLDANFGPDSNGVSDVANTYLYTGRERDPETGLQINRNRFYASQLGRWPTRDPLRYFDGFNLYAYVHSNPVLDLDPFGTSSARAGNDSGLPPLTEQDIKDCYCELSNSSMPGMDYKCKCLEWALQEQESDKDWLDDIPDCPCSIGTPPANPDPNIWHPPGPADPKFHPGATTCVRSKGSESNGSGQQCCYDKSGALITGGAGAGTPDYWAPEGPISIPGHFNNDVLPAIVCQKSGCFDRYLEARPPNNGNGCPGNP